MNTPICDFVRQYAEGDPIRLHMPGHKGASFIGSEALDITEIPGADVLYHADGILLESQRNAASLFGSGKTLYSAEGSSLPIRAMLYLASIWAKQTGRRACIAAGRNAHKVFVTASALLDLEVRWIYPEDREGLICCKLTAPEVERFLRENREVTAVYLTSPDYLGNLTELLPIHRVCQKYGCLLLVDNAHGAYLKFLKEDLHPMSLGADLCCDSAHKTLPVLTGGAYLHISPHAPEWIRDSAEQAMALFASTSPSYLILQSLDSANRYLSEGYREKLHRAVTVWSGVRKQLEAEGYMLSGQEPLKLTIMAKSRGYTGETLGSILGRQGIVCEFADPDHLVLMLPVEFPQTLPEKLMDALIGIPAREPIRTPMPELRKGKQVMTPHQALFLPSEEVDVPSAVGRIMASPEVSCPPAIPVAVCGERIEEWSVEAMTYYGISKIRVIQEQ